VTRKLDTRPRNCVVCEKRLNVLSVSSPTAGAPEFLQPSPGAWITFVQGDVNLEMVLACSEKCVQRLLAH